MFFAVLQVTINSGLTIFFDGKDSIYIRSKPDLCSKVAGMCGNFNALTTDDFRTPKGDTAANANDFGDEWCGVVCVHSLNFTRYLSCTIGKTVVLDGKV